jgi:hypothetical protein
MWTALLALHRSRLAAGSGGVLLVHGGGKAVDRLLDRLGLVSERREGIRITTPEQIDVVTAVLAGSVNKSLVGCINRVASASSLPNRAVGLCLGDGGLCVSAKSTRFSFDPGRVGDVAGGDGALARVLFGGGFIPVLCSIGLDESGKPLNINADDAAAALVPVIGRLRPRADDRCAGHQERERPGRRRPHARDHRTDDRLRRDLRRDDPEDPSRGAGRDQHRRRRVHHVRRRTRQPHLLGPWQARRIARPRLKSPTLTSPAMSDPFRNSDLLDLAPLAPVAIQRLFALTRRIKADITPYRRALDGKTVVMLFEKPSLRTRVSFETGINKLGGAAIYLDHGNQRLGERESVADYGKEPGAVGGVHRRPRLQAGGP